MLWPDTGAAQSRATPAPSPSCLSLAGDSFGHLSDKVATGQLVLKAPWVAAGLVDTNKSPAWTSAFSSALEARLRRPVAGEFYCRPGERAAGLGKTLLWATWGFLACVVGWTNLTLWSLSLKGFPSFGNGHMSAAWSSDRRG